MSRSILEQARRASERLDGAAMTPEESALLFQRIDATVTEPRGRPLLVPSLAAAATACAALVVALWPAGPEPEPEPAWYRVTAGATCVSAPKDNLVEVTGCDRPVVLEIDEGRLTLAGSTTIAREQSAVRVNRGEVAFWVRPAVAGDRFEVRVSHGAILTISTMFNVAQGESSGRVQVESGSIEFRWADSSAPQVVSEGESLSWPRAEPEPEVEPEPAPEEVEPERNPLLRSTQPKPRPSPESQLVPATDVATIMLRLSQLRSQERYQEAFALLRQASQRADLSTTQRERFSFEAGVLLEEKLDQPVGACAHWREHIERFPTGSRSAQVRARLSICR